jgi:hypothetical protein
MLFFLIFCATKTLQVNINGNLLQVYVPQNTTVPQNTSLIYFLYKIWRKYAINFIFVIIY